MNVLHLYSPSEQRGDFLWSEAGNSATDHGNQESQLRMLLSKLNELFHVLSLRLLMLLGVKLVFWVNDGIAVRAYS